MNPVPKPRMTRADKWQQRDCVMRYRAFADEIRLRLRELPERFHVTFYIAMPPSWTDKKRAEHIGKPHRQKPDADNLLKALNDAMRQNDAVVWDCRVTKLWAEKPGISIKEIE